MAQGNGLKKIDQNTLRNGMSKKDIVDAINLLSGGELAGHIEIFDYGNSFKITKDIQFGRFIDSELKTTNGLTVGEMNREYLHKCLDMFLNKGNFEDF
jgi:hypothetical protein